MNMNEKIYIVECLASEYGVFGYDEPLRDNYSGRCMYGATCFGIVTDDPEGLIEAAIEAGLKGARTDSMGFDTIVYWPSITNSQT